MTGAESSVSWDLSALYGAPADWEADRLATAAELERFAGEVAGGVGAAARLAVLYEQRDALLVRLQRVAAFADLRQAENGLDQARQAAAAQTLELQTRTAAAMHDLEQALLELAPAELEAMAADPTLAAHARELQRLHHVREHRLDAGTESLLEELAPLMQLPGLVQQVGGLELGARPVMVDGEERPLAPAGFAFQFARSADREVRTDAADKLADALSKRQLTAATALGASIRRDAILARRRRYDSPEAMFSVVDGVDPRIFADVLDGVFTDVAPHVHRLMRLRSRVLGLEAMALSDIQAPLGHPRGPGRQGPARAQLFRRQSDVHRGSLTRR